MGHSISETLVFFFTATSFWILFHHQKCFWHFYSTMIMQNDFPPSRASSCSAAMTSGNSDSSSHSPEKMAFIMIHFYFHPPLFWPEIRRLLKIVLTPVTKMQLYIHSENSGNTVKAEYESRASAEQFSTWNFFKWVKRAFKNILSTFSLLNYQEMLLLPGPSALG